MIRRRSTVLIVAIASGITFSTALTGCSAPEVAPTDEPTTSVTPTDTPTVAPTEDPRIFTMPTQCASVLPESRLASFDSSGLVLLGGPGGLYGGDYLLDPTPEESVGGITCIWGFADTEISSITISVAPVSTDSLGRIIDSFISSGLNESQLDGASIFGKQGDAETTPAVINSIRATSWISVISTVGGVAPYEQAQAMVAEVTATVYTAP
jgi:hypothetical protein